MSEQLAPLFESRETRLGRLPEQARTRFQEAEKTALGNGNADFADRQFVSFWLSHRTGLPRRDVLSSFDNLTKRYFGEGVTAAGAYDAISKTYQREGQAVETSVKPQDGGAEAIYAQTEGLPKATKASFLAQVGQAVRSMGAGVQQTAQQVPAGFYSQAATITGAPGLLSPMEDAKYRALKLQNEKLQSPYEFSGGGGDDRSFGPVLTQAEEELIAKNEARMTEIVRGKDAVSREQLKEWSDSVQGDASNEFRRLSKFWYQLSEGASERMGVDPEFEKTLFGGFMKSAGSVPATAALAVMGPGGWVGMESLFFGQVEAERMAKEGADYDPESAAPSNLASAIPQAFLERALGTERLMNKVLGELPKMRGRVSFGDFAKGFARVGLTSGTEEAITESAQNFWNDYIASLSYDEKRELFTAEAGKQRLIESVSAFALGFAFGGGISTVETIDRNRAVGAGERYLLTKEGQPLETPDFEVLRQTKTDKEIMVGAPDVETGKVLVLAANGDKAAQADYNNRVKKALFKDTEGVEVDGAKLGTVNDVPAFIGSDGMVISLDVGNPEHVAFMDEFKRRVIEQVTTTETLAKMKERFGETLEVSQPAKLATLEERVASGQMTQEQADDALAVAKDINGLARELTIADVRPEGSATVKQTTDGIWKMVVEVAQASDPTKAIEEVSEAYIHRAYKTQNLLPADLQAARLRWHEQNGETDAAAAFQGDALDRANIEWFSKRVIDYALANRKTELPGGWGKWLRTLGEQLKRVLGGATRMRKLMREGKLDAELESWMKGALGITAEGEAFGQTLDNRAGQMEQANAENAPTVDELGTELMETVQADETFPKIEKNDAGEGYLVSSPDGRFLGSRATMEEAQDLALAWFDKNDRMQAMEQAREESGEVSGNELMQVMKRHKLPAPSMAGVFRGEMQALAESMTLAQRLQIFRKTEMDLDMVRQAVNEDGFNFETVDDFLNALDNSVRGIPVFGNQGGTEQVTFSLSDISFEPFGRAGAGDFIARLNGKEIGYASVSETDSENPYLSNVRINEPYRGKGLGKAFYLYIEGQLGKKLRPSPLGVSESAQRVWDSRRAVPEDASNVVEMPDGAQLVGPTTFAIKAYHGTPHKVDRFNTAKIGTGEGSQVFGWGLYFAQEKKVAEGYAESLGPGRGAGAIDVAQRILNAVGGNVPKALAEVENRRKTATMAGAKERFDEIEALIRSGAGLSNLYTVQLLPDAEEFIDWDKTVAEQSPKVRAFMRSQIEKWTAELTQTFEDIRQGKGAEGWGTLAYVPKNVLSVEETKASTDGATFYRRMIDDAPKGRDRAQYVSETLAKAGIPGIKYLDQFSRDGASDAETGVKRVEERLKSLRGQLATLEKQGDADGVAEVTGQISDKEQELVSAKRALNELTRNFVLFDSDLVQILEENGQARTEQKTTFSLAAPSPVFYSRVIRTVEQSTQNKASGAQWKATIRNSKLGVNKDEFALVGVSDLEDGKTYTKAEVLDYLRANEVKVQDVTLGEGDYAVSDGENKTYFPNRAEAEANARERGINVTEDTVFRATNRAGGYGTFFSSYTLPGAIEGSYREVLLTVPDNEKPLYTKENLTVNYDESANRSNGIFWIIEGPGQVFQIPKSRGDSEQAINYIIDTKQPATGWRDGHSQYSDIRNPIVRLRYNERVTTDGKKMLFLEEVQGPQKQEFEKMPELFQKNWREIGFKWALRKAVEGGFDVLGWTTGDQQAERYDLSKELDHIDYWKDGDDYGIQALDKKGTVVFREEAVSLNRIEEVGGKGIAKRVGETATDQPQRIKEEGLKVGGEGLRKLYDSDFRNVVNGLPVVKKTGQKVGTAELGGLYQDRSVVGSMTLQELQSKVADIRDKWEGPNRTAEGWQFWNVSMNRQAQDVINGMIAGETFEESFLAVGSTMLAQKLGVQLVETPRKTLVNSLDLTSNIQGGAMQGQATFSLAPIEGKPSDRINFERLNELGFTNDFREAGYMTPDGKLIDLSGKREGGQRGMRSYDYREAGGSSGMMQLQNMGFIRMQPESGGLDMVQKPTGAQEGVIRRYVETFNGKVLMDLQDGIGQWVESGDMSAYTGASRRTYLEFPEGTKAVKVLGMIRRFYAGENVAGMTFSLEDRTFATTGIPRNQSQSMQARIAAIRSKQLAATAAMTAAVAKGPLPKRAAQARRGFEASWLTTVFTPLTGRLGDVSKKVLQRSRRFEVDLAKAMQADFKQVEPFLKGFEAMRDADFAVLDLALKNGDTDTRDVLLTAYNLTNEFAQVEALFEQTRQRVKAAGFEVGMILNYFPRKVNDYEKLHKFYYGTPAQGILEKAVTEARKKAKDAGVVLSQEQETMVINNAIQRLARPAGGSKPSNLKGRVTDVVSVGANEFYATSTEALLGYIQQINQAVEKRRFFGKHAVTMTTATGGKYVSNALAVKESVGGIVGEMLAAGEITAAQQEEVQTVMTSRFAQASTPQFFRDYKSLVYLTTMGQLTSAITQLGDTMWSLYESGFYETAVAFAKSAGKKSKITREDLGIEQLGEEFREVGKLAALVNGVFKYTGLTHMDRMGKETLINAKFAAMSKAAKAGKLTAKDQARIDASFEPAQAAQVMADLAKGKRTADTDFLIWSVLADYQPISLLDYPTGYLDNPRLRLFYTLKTYSIKHIESLRREAVSQMVHGNKAQKIQGGTNLLKIAGLFFMIGMPVDWIKDWLMMRDPQIGTIAVDNIFKLFGLSRWGVWQFRNEDQKILAAFKMIAPPVPFLDYPLEDLTTVEDRMTHGEAVEFADLESVRMIPFAGGPMYWGAGAGAKAVEKRAKKREDIEMRGGEAVLEEEKRRRREARYQATP